MVHSAQASLRKQVLKNDLEVRELRALRQEFVGNLVGTVVGTE